MTPKFIALATDDVERYRAGGPDAYGRAPERRIAAEDGYPCRHCMRDIRKGEAYLTLAHRPFPALQPYAETGPIFLHAEACARGAETNAMPAFLDSPQYIVRGYGHDDHIVYGTGTVTPTGDIPEVAATLLGRDDVAYLHVRSATNNCYHCRIERG